jgi:hypothetical protein
MDASVLQAAQRVVNWLLQHVVMPAPPPEPSERAGDEDPGAATEGQAEAEHDGPAPSRV